MDSLVLEATIKSQRSVAIPALDAKKTAIDQSINALVNVSAEDKATALSEVASAHSTYTTQIADLTDASEITTALTAGEKAMDDIYAALKQSDDTLLSNAKTQATNEINTRADAALASVNSNNALTAEEKATYITTINAKRTSALAEVESMTHVTQADDIISGAQSVFDDAVTNAHKADATKRVTEHANTVLQTIADMQDLDEAERAYAVNYVETTL